MTKSITNNQQSLLRGVTAGLFALMLAVFAMPAQAQMDDGELPKIDFSVNLAQHAQYLSIDTPGSSDPDPIMGFQRVRAGLNASVQFSENVNGLLMIEQEPNDFGFNTVNPAVDFAILNVQATDQLTIQAGTPVTGLLNFRGFSDGPVVQSNPLINNSPADMITAGQGVKLIGSYPSFGFDLTIARGFGGPMTSGNPGAGNPGLNGNSSFADPSGVEIIGKARYTGSDMFKFGAGVAFGTGQTELNFGNGDGDNIDLGDVAGSPTRSGVHPSIPNSTIFQADGKVMVAGADIDGWVGYGTESTPSDDTQAALFGGLGVKYDINDSFYIAGRATAVSDQSDDAATGAVAALRDANDNSVSDLDKTLTRFQLGVGYEIYDKALLKVEGFQQSHGETGISAPVPAESFTGVMTELSFNF